MTNGYVASYLKIFSMHQVESSSPILILLIEVICFKCSLQLRNDNCPFNIVVIQTAVFHLMMLIIVCSSEGRILWVRKPDKRPTHSRK